MGEPKIEFVSHDDAMRHLQSAWDKLQAASNRGHDCDPLVFTDLEAFSLSSVLCRYVTPPKDTSAHG